MKPTKREKRQEKENTGRENNKNKQQEYTIRRKGIHTATQQYTISRSSLQVPVSAAVRLSPQPRLALPRLPCYRQVLHQINTCSSRERAYLLLFWEYWVTSLLLFYRLWCVVLLLTRNFCVSFFFFFYLNRISCLSSRISDPVIRFSFKWVFLFHFFTWFTPFLIQLFVAELTSYFYPVKRQYFKA